MFGSRGNSSACFVDANCEGALDIDHVARQPGADNNAVDPRVSDYKRQRRSGEAKVRRGAMQLLCDLGGTRLFRFEQSHWIYAPPIFWVQLLR